MFEKEEEKNQTQPNPEILRIENQMKAIPLLAIETIRLMAADVPSDSQEISRIIHSLELNLQLFEQFLQNLPATRPEAEELLRELQAYNGKLARLFLQTINQLNSPDFIDDIRQKIIKLQEALTRAGGPPEAEKNQPEINWQQFIEDGTWLFKHVVGPLRMQLTATDIQEIETRFNRVLGVYLNQQGVPADFPQRQLAEDFLRQISTWSAKIQEVLMTLERSATSVVFDSTKYLADEANLPREAIAYRDLCRELEANLNTLDPRQTFRNGLNAIDYLVYVRQPLQNTIEAWDISQDVIVQGQALALRSYILDEGIRIRVLLEKRIQELDRQEFIAWQDPVRLEGLHPKLAILNLLINSPEPQDPQLEQFVADLETALEEAAEILDPQTHLSYTGDRANYIHTHYLQKAENRLEKLRKRLTEQQRVQGNPREQAAKAAHEAKLKPLIDIVDEINRLPDIVSLTTLEELHQRYQAIVLEIIEHQHLLENVEEAMPGARLINLLIRNIGQRRERADKVLREKIKTAETDYQHMDAWELTALVINKDWEVGAFHATRMSANREMADLATAWKGAVMDPHPELIGDDRRALLMTTVLLHEVANKIQSASKSAHSDREALTKELESRGLNTIEFKRISSSPLYGEAVRRMVGFMLESASLKPGERIILTPTRIHPETGRQLYKEVLLTAEQQRDLNADEKLIREYLPIIQYGSLAGPTGRDEALPRLVRLALDQVKTDYPEIKAIEWTYLERVMRDAFLALCWLDNIHAQRSRTTDTKAHGEEEMFKRLMLLDDVAFTIHCLSRYVGNIYGQEAFYLAIWQLDPNSDYGGSNHFETAKAAQELLLAYQACFYNVDLIKDAIPPLPPCQTFAPSTFDLFFQAPQEIIPMGPYLIDHRGKIKGYRDDHGYAYAIEWQKNGQSVEDGIINNPNLLRANERYRDEQGNLVASTDCAERPPGSHNFVLIYKDAQGVEIDNPSFEQIIRNPLIHKDEGMVRRDDVGRPIDYDYGVTYRDRRTGQAVFHQAEDRFVDQNNRVVAFEMVEKSEHKVDYVWLKYSQVAEKLFDSKGQVIAIEAGSEGAKFFYQVFPRTPGSANYHNPNEIVANGRGKTWHTDGCCYQQGQREPIYRRIGNRVFDKDGEVIAVYDNNGAAWVVKGLFKENIASSPDGYQVRNIANFVTAEKGYLNMHKSVVQALPYPLTHDAIFVQPGLYNLGDKDGLGLAKMYFKAQKQIKVKDREGRLIEYDLDPEVYRVAWDPMYYLITAYKRQDILRYMALFPATGRDRQIMAQLFVEKFRHSAEQGGLAGFPEASKVLIDWLVQNVNGDRWDFPLPRGIPIEKVAHYYQLLAKHRPFQEHPGDIWFQLGLYPRLLDAESDDLIQEARKNRFAIKCAFDRGKTAEDKK